MAAANAGHDDIETMLIRASADVNAKDANGNTALMYAVDSGSIAAVRVLLDSGADRHAKNRSGLTAAQRRRRTSPSISRGSISKGSLRERFLSFLAADDDPIVRLLREASTRT
jgi:ankyrin repeat protein